jgi:predicted HicB family RNase H-like nuclease
MSRPTLPPEQRRSRRVNVHLTESEHARLEARAKANGVPLGRLLREAGLAECGP